MKTPPLLTRIMSFLICLLPVRIQLFIGDIFGWLWFDVLRIRRNIALDNLQNCYPESTDAWRIKIARASVCNIGRSLIEFLRIPNYQNFREHFELIGEEHLKSALQKNKGVFLLTGHIGSGDWGNTGLALNGYPTNVITKKIKWPPLNRFWFQTRSFPGIQLIEDRGSSLAILKGLKRNNIIVFVLDQFMGPPIGVKTQFFGLETGTPMGLAILAERSRAAVVPCFTYRKPDGRTVIELEPEIPFLHRDDKETTIQTMTQTYSDKVEEWVRKHPDQWMWVHRRWKRFKV